MTKYIYKLERTGSIGFDEMSAIVVIADSNWEAREIAIRNACDETPKEWVDCKIQLLGTAFSTESRVVLRDILNG